MSDNLARLIMSLSDAELAGRAEAFEQSGDTELYHALLTEQVRRSGLAVEALEMTDAELDRLTERCANGDPDAEAEYELVTRRATLKGWGEID